MEEIKSIDGNLLRQMVISGAALLERNRVLVDSLNVFPVPDGDTGSNMSLTFNAAAKEARAVQASDVSTMAAMVAKGALRGARGNSGVILSQLMRGMAQSFEGAKNVDVQQFAQALQQGSQSAYKAVMKPKEGTILTVAREVADKALACAEEGMGLRDMLEAMIAYGDAVLEKTPDMLPVLKEAGVVDSGGKGLMFIYRGYLMAVNGDEVDSYVEPAAGGGAFGTGAAAGDFQHDNSDILLADSIDDIVYGYCTEFFVEHLKDGVGKKDIDELHDNLQRIGDSVVAVSDEDLIKIHVHTNVPGKALQMGMRLGELNGVKIENMREQHREIIRERKAQEKELGVVTISSGAGLDAVFRDLQAEGIVSGGQSMNPSAEDIEKAIRRVNARNVFVLPNNKNIQMAAEQAVAIIAHSSEDKNAYVVPTRSIQEGIAALMVYDERGHVEDNLAAMQEAIASVRSASITRAVRDSHVNGMEIKDGDVIGLIGSDIQLVGQDRNQVLLDVVDKLMGEEAGDVLTLIYGEDVDEATAKAGQAAIEEKYPDLEIGLQNGGQPLYDYLLSIE